MWTNDCEIIWQKPFNQWLMLDLTQDSTEYAQSFASSHRIYCLVFCHSRCHCSNKGTWLACKSANQTMQSLSHTWIGMQVLLLAWTPSCSGGPVPFMFNMPIRAEEQDGVYADGIKTLGCMSWRDLHIHGLLTFVNPTKLLARITQLNKFWMYYDNILSLGPMRSLPNSLLRWLHGVTPEVQAIHKTTTNTGPIFLWQLRLLVILMPAGFVWLHFCNSE